MESAHKLIHLRKTHLDGMVNDIIAQLDKISKSDFFQNQFLLRGNVPLYTDDAAEQLNEDLCQLARFGTPEHVAQVRAYAQEYGWNLSYMSYIPDVTDGAFSEKVKCYHVIPVPPSNSSDK